MPEVTLDHRLGDIVTMNLHSAKVLEHYEIDYYCNGGRTLREACDANGIDAGKLISELGSIDKQTDADFASMTIDTLIEYIVNTHHAFMKKLLPDISQRFHKIEELEGPLPSDTIALIHAFHELKAELTAHTATEEKDVFPYINSLYKLSTSDDANLRGSLNTQILQMENEHVNAKNGVGLLRSLTGNFVPEDSNKTAITDLFKLLQSLYYDVHLHIHMENNLLHPRAVQLEKSLL